LGGRFRAEKAVESAAYKAQLLRILVYGELTANVSPR
jgi:hypothetical protein